MRRIGARAAWPAEIGISHVSVQRIWAEAGLKPHLVSQFKISNDPKFAEKVTDVVGLYLNPPDKALVLCVDEKSQIQALDRTQPGLPMKKGRAATMTHDYKRNGTTTLFAALDVKTGLVIGECQPRHRAKEFIRFLKTIERSVTKHLDLHLIVDNYTTHKTKEVQAWLAKHPRFKLHFTPTCSSWLNLVERFFAEITGKRIRRGIFKSVAELEAAIDYLATQCRTQTLRLDQDCRCHPRQDCKGLYHAQRRQNREPSVGDATLGASEGGAVSSTAVLVGMLPNRGIPLRSPSLTNYPHTGYGAGRYPTRRLSAPR